jgi:hypothetical protein
MSEPLCKDLTLSIWREDDPDEKDRERIRVRIENPMEMMEAESTYQINVTTQQSRRYHIKEAVVIVLRQAVSEAFRVGLIADSLGEWKITKPKAAPKQEVEIDMNDSML